MGRIHELKLLVLHVHIFCTSNNVMFLEISFINRLSYISVMKVIRCKFFHATFLMAPVMTNSAFS